VITAIKKNLLNFAAILGLFVVAGGVSLYILDKQRLRFPLIDEKPFVVKAEFSTAQAVTAGQGQTVRVSGVRIGDIGDVELRDGRAIVKMDIDRKYADMIRTDASALLRPKTGLKDMFVELDPGSDGAPVEDGYTIPIKSTLPDVNPDEIFAALDADTRAYLKLLVNGAGQGLEGRGSDLRDVFTRFEPIHRDIARVNSAVAERRQHLRRLINSLRVLNQELADNDDELAGLVQSSASVLRAFASQEGNLSDAVRELPAALAETTAALQKVQGFAEILGPTAEKLRPAARALDPANKAVIPFAKEAAPQLKNQIRPFVRELRPLARDLKPAASNLSDATPDLTGAFSVLNAFLNMATYNQDGREPPEKASRQEGFLFWLAWVNHQALNLFSSADAHGTFRPVTLGAPCQTVKQIVDERPEFEFLAGLTAILADSEACGK
jgi:phospholipid/cholesterol/gamma-HCH transport system substrate-binding protein